MRSRARLVCLTTVASTASMACTVLLETSGLSGGDVGMPFAADDASEAARGDDRGSDGDAGSAADVTTEPRGGGTLLGNGDFEAATDACTGWQVAGFSGAQGTVELVTSGYQSDHACRLCGTVRNSGLTPARLPAWDGGFASVNARVRAVSSSTSMGAITGYYDPVVGSPRAYFQSSFTALNTTTWMLLQVGLEAAGPVRDFQVAVDETTCIDIDDVELTYTK